MARAFNGSSDKIVYGNIKPTSGPQSFSAWIFSNNSITGDERVFSNQISGDSTYALLCQFGTTNHTEIVIGTSALTLKSYSNNGSVPNGSWFHYLWTWDGSLTAVNIHQFINNSELGYQTQDNGSGTIDVPAGSVSLGWVAAGPVLDGKYASVGWWDRVLTADERKSLSKGFSPLCIPKGLKFAPDLIRNQRDLVSGQAGVLTGTTVVEHPRIILPCGGL